MAIKVHSSFSVHPGPWLRTELVEPYRLTIVAAAEALGQRFTAGIQERARLAAQLIIAEPRAWYAACACGDASQ